MCTDTAYGGVLLGDGISLHVQYITYTIETLVLLNVCHIHAITSLNVEGYSPMVILLYFSLD